MLPNSLRVTTGEDREEEEEEEEERQPRMKGEHSEPTSDMTGTSLSDFPPLQGPREGEREGTDRGIDSRPMVDATFPFQRVRVCRNFE
ncbi:hypothetical protein E2C01_079714 [Portunus trituberculatus]|uniref:Uncharacterized protein n=1 Tax=Portunus trituberculatus TaxID=210409 RepID=A0A5B7IS27_PORTR|nr:hypothetical protein [Portunus trituberculatus]